MWSRIALAMCLCAVHGCTDDREGAHCVAVSAAPPAMSAAITATLEGLKEKYQLDAVIAGVEQDGTPLVRTALGISGGGVPATTDMHFRIGGVGWQHLV